MFKRVYLNKYDRSDVSKYIYIQTYLCYFDIKGNKLFLKDHEFKLEKIHLENIIFWGGINKETGYE